MADVCQARLSSRPGGVQFADDNRAGGPYFPRTMMQQRDTTTTTTRFARGRLVAH